MKSAIFDRDPVGGPKKRSTGLRKGVGNGIVPGSGKGTMTKNTNNGISNTNNESQNIHNGTPIGPTGMTNSNNYMRNTSSVGTPVQNSKFSSGGYQSSSTQNSLKKSLQPSQNPRKVQSASPYPRTSSVFSSPKPNQPSAGSKLKRKNTVVNSSMASHSITPIPWNLDDMLASYQDNGLLPPPLSPSLPSSLNNPSDTSSISSTTSTTTTAYDDDVPLSMLSPTLPSIFESRSSRELQLPAPKRARSVGVGLTSTPRDSESPSPPLIQNKSAQSIPVPYTQSNTQSNSSLLVTVKRSLNNPTPKFIVQISVPPPKSPTKRTTRPMAGLGITTSSTNTNSKPKSDPIKEAGLLATTSNEEEQKNKLIHRKNYWVQLARETKQRAKELVTLEKPIMAIIVRFDSILLYIISCDYEEKVKLATKALPLERYWSILMQDCMDLIKLIKTTPASDPQWELLIGILHLTRAVVLKRINSILNRTVQLYMNKRSDGGNIIELTNKIIELQRTQISNSEYISVEFRLAEQYHQSGLSAKYFPKTWAKRLNDIPNNSNSTTKTSIVPGTDSFYLPIGIYSDLQDVGGYMFSCVREMMEIIASDNLRKFVYLLKSGLKERENGDGV